MKPYAFEAIGPDLELMPLAARRAADRAGSKPSLAAWKSLAHAVRKELCALGAAREVDVERAALLLAAAEPAPASVAPLADPLPQAPPESLQAALGPERPLSAAAWSALAPLDRYALTKVAVGRSADKLAPAYAEIVGTSAQSTHLDADGGARMVGVSDKAPSARRAVAASRVAMSAPAFERLLRADAPKGDVLGTARLAGILGAKRTADLVPLCHPIAITRVDLSFELDPAQHAVDIRASVEAFDRTGVEMEALSAVSAAALTVYDMLKAFDRDMQIGPTRLLEKSGGRSGAFRASEDRPRRAASVADPRGDRFRIQPEPLLLEDATRAVARPEAGAIVLFVGVVRAQNDGHAVTRLDYEAYAAMAVREMQSIASELESEIPGVRLAALHRTGELAVGEAAVLCAASAPHRDEAFRACRALIDRLKQRVPIWKREHGPDGSEWIGWEDARIPPRGS